MAMASDIADSEETAQSCPVSDMEDMGVISQQQGALSKVGRILKRIRTQTRSVVHAGERSSTASRHCKDILGPPPPEGHTKVNWVLVGFHGQHIDMCC